MTTRDSGYSSDAIRHTFFGGNADLVGDFFKKFSQFHAQNHTVLANEKIASGKYAAAVANARKVLGQADEKLAHAPSDITSEAPGSRK